MSRWAEIRRREIVQVKSQIVLEFSRQSGHRPVDQNPKHDPPCPRTSDNSFSQIGPKPRCVEFVENQALESRYIAQGSSTLIRIGFGGKREIIGIATITEAFFCRDRSEARISAMK